MSLKRNIFANYASQIYITLVGILLVPLYIEYMGAEAYGLVGFFAMLQAWFNLLDLGLSPTINRQTAQYRGGAISALEYRKIVRAISLIFILVAIIGAGILLLFSEIISIKWLKTEGISKSEIVLCVQIMSLSIALRWICGLYRGIISGSEQQVWLSFFSIVITTFKFLGVIPVMQIYGKTPTIFFVYQLTICILEVSFLYMKNSKILPIINKDIKIGWSINSIKPHLHFALSIALTSTLWVTVTQADKLILSGTLSLKEYGFFTVATMIAGAIMILSGPVSNALIPRLARLFAENNTSQAIKTYRNSTKAIILPTGILTLTLAFFSKEILHVWSGNIDLEINTYSVLTAYAIGNGIMVISSLPTHLQVAKGNLKIHVIGSIFFSLILLPSTAIASLKFGGKGAAYAWMFTNLIYFFTFPSIIHNSINVNLHKKWLFNDVLKPLAIVFLIFSISASVFELITPIDPGKIFLIVKILFSLFVTAISIVFLIKLKLKVLNNDTA